MRNRLSYYSVILLVGLAVASATLLVANPFSGSPAGASPAATSVTAAQSSTSATHSAAVPQPFQPATGSGTVHHDGSLGGSQDHVGGNGGSSSGSSTTTTTALFAPTVDN